MIIKCHICGLSQACDSYGEPYYPHDHDASGAPTYVRDRNGTVLFDMRKNMTPKTL